MKFIMDMVHDNPGEERFNTSFRNPEKLIEYGFNTQVFKHNNTTVTLKVLGEDFFSEPGGHEWLSKMENIAYNEHNSAHKEGLMTMCHIDLFVLPKLLVEKYKDEICDENGKISIYKDKTKEIHRLIFDEIFEKYEVDGLIIRVGETYLYDTPYHTGNGAVTYGDIEAEKNAFVELINFLKEEVCIKHNKYLVFRTWDCFGDKFHANPDYYLDITNRIEPCEKLIFSIKYTAFDFWRRVKFNQCLGIGKHQQVIEVQCQREYEGKGAYPNYIMNDVINGASELKEKKGLKDIMDNPLICGIYAWSRGGGWRGPYIKNEFWCDLNAYVISQYAQNPTRTEEEIFEEYATKTMGMDKENAKKFHNICKKSSDAILRGRYIEGYDKSLNEDIMPCKNWIRDDDIGGLRQLNEVFDYLEEHNLVEDAICEKELSLKLWNEIKEEFKEVSLTDKKLRSFIETSIDYGITLYTIVYIAFKIFAKCRKSENVSELLKEYDKAWEDHINLTKKENTATPYHDYYTYSPDRLGLNETIKYCREKLS